MKTLLSAILSAFLLCCAAPLSAQAQAQLRFIRISTTGTACESINAIFCFKEQDPRESSFFASPIKATLNRRATTKLDFTILPSDETLPVPADPTCLSLGGNKTLIRSISFSSDRDFNSERFGLTFDAKSLGVKPFPPFDFISSCTPDPAHQLSLRGQVVSGSVCEPKNLSPVNYYGRFPEYPLTDPRGELIPLNIAKREIDTECPSGIRSFLNQTDIPSSSSGTKFQVHASPEIDIDAASENLTFVAELTQSTENSATPTPTPVPTTVMPASTPTASPTSAVDSLVTGTRLPATTFAFASTTGLFTTNVGSDGKLSIRIPNGSYVITPIAPAGFTVIPLTSMITVTKDTVLPEGMFVLVSVDPLADPTPAPNDELGITPLVECVADSPKGLIARFSYRYEGAAALSISSSIVNTLSGDGLSSENKNMTPKILNPGYEKFAFEVPIAKQGGSVTWTLGEKSVTASAKDSRCPPCFTQGRLSCLACVQTDVAALNSSLGETLRTLIQQGKNVVKRLNANLEKDGDKEAKEYLASRRDTLIKLEKEGLSLLDKNFTSTVTVCKSSENRCVRDDKSKVISRLIKIARRAYGLTGGLILSAEDIFGKETLAFRVHSRVTYRLMTKLISQLPREIGVCGDTVRIY